MPETRAVGQQEDTAQPDEPAAPGRVVAAYRTASGSVRARPGVTCFCMAPVPVFSKPGPPVRIDCLPMAAPSRGVCR